MTDGQAPRYTFGDTRLAADRLLLLAEVFDAPSRAFLDESVTEPPLIALDVGCGPGATTRLVAEVTRAQHTIGLDTSPAFIELARAHERVGVTFVLHDATELPLPYTPADLIYCRLLMAHIADVATAVTGLISQLSVGGRLLIDELEWITSDHPVFSRYERIVVDLVASRGATMYAGPFIERLHAGDRWEQRASRVCVVPVATRDAARMFGMNLTTWRDDHHIRAHYDPGEIDRLGQDLEAMVALPGTDDITWGIRQLVYERTR